MSILINSCKCGGKNAALQDFGSIRFVKCPDCGQKSNTIEQWNQINNTQPERPSSVTVTGNEYLEWCARAKRGEVNIATVTVVRNGTYRLTLWYENAFRLTA